MSADPRSRAQRRRDTEHRLTHDKDVWVGQYLGGRCTVPGAAVLRRRRLRPGAPRCRAGESGSALAVREHIGSRRIVWVTIGSPQRPEQFCPETRKGRITSPLLQSGRRDSNSGPLDPQTKGTSRREWPGVAKPALERHFPASETTCTRRESPGAVSRSFPCDASSLAAACRLRSARSNRRAYSRKVIAASAWPSCSDTYTASSPCATRIDVPRSSAFDLAPSRLPLPARR